LDIQNNNFGYPKINIYFRYQKLLFWISEIVIYDIQNNYFGYQKLCQKGVLFEISKKVILDIKKQQFRISENKHLFRISKIVIMDIRNGYLKK